MRAVGDTALQGAGEGRGPGKDGTELRCRHLETIETIRPVGIEGAGEGARHLDRVLGKDIDAERAVVGHRPRDPAVGLEADKNRWRIRGQRGKGAHRGAGLACGPVRRDHCHGRRDLSHCGDEGVPRRAHSLIALS